MESREIRDLIESYYSVYDQDLNEMTMPPKDHDKAKKPQPKPSEKRSGPMGEQGVFDIVKGHLLDEGYADTEQAALAIMANMSEEWKQSIVEGGIFDFLPKNKVIVPGRYGKNTVLSMKKGVEGVSDKSRPGTFTPIKGGFDRVDAERYADERLKQGDISGGINLANRRERPRGPLTGPNAIK